MWIFTPDLAYNSEMYKSIWADGQTPILRFEPGDGTFEDGISFDSVESSVKAFDAVMNGISNGYHSVFLHEIYEGNNTRLVVEYNKADYKTIIDNTNPCIIKDPRTWSNTPIVATINTRVIS